MHMHSPGFQESLHGKDRDGIPREAPVYRRALFVGLVLIVVAALGMVIVPGSPVAHVMAAGAVPSMPTSINAMSGSQQVALTWATALNATGYIIEQTDLSNGQVQRLANVVAGTSSQVTGLAVGRWYRFRIVPVNGTIEGAPSNPIEVRTAGFSGTYDHYYVMGDSYSAGEGAPPYTGAKGCYRSTNSYGYQLSSGAPTPVMLACSGAISDDIDKVVQNAGLPGTQLQQLQANPLNNSLITLTIGGNDVAFAKELENCIFGLHSCVTRQAAIAQKIVALEPRLVQVYQEIRQAAPGADIVVLGYPLLVAAPDVAQCHNPVIAVGLSKSEMTMIRQLAAQLNGVIKQAAVQAGVASVTDQVEQDFAGHEVCTKNANNEWINEITGLTAMVHGSFHPKTAGYLADAMAVNAGRTALYQSGMVIHA